MESYPLELPEGWTRLPPRTWKNWELHKERMITPRSLQA